jgi:isocitrate/methylisocitrate lyase
LMSESHFKKDAIAEIESEWKSDRWKGIVRPYAAEDVLRLRGTLQVEHTLASVGARKFWSLLNSRSFIPSLGALSGGQAVQMVQGGLKAIYVSGWQVAAEANLAGNTYPDQSLYPVNSVPNLVKRINQALQRADQIQHSERSGSTDWFVPLIADGEAGFGGPLNVFELTKSMIEAGAAAVHFEDQLSSEKKCGHLGGKVLVPVMQFIRTLVAARLAADVLGVPTVIIARTDANSAQLITSDIDQRETRFLTGERTPEGFYKFRGGLEAAIGRALTAAPFADLIWCETAKPDIEEARKFAEGVHAVYPEKMLAYNCSPSFHWEKQLSSQDIHSFQRELSGMGYKFQFITLAGFHAMNHSMFDLAREYSEEGMTAYVKLQRREFESEEEGYKAVKHQKFVGTGYFDLISEVIAGGMVSTTAMNGSTEQSQFSEDKPEIAPSVPLNKSSIPN